MRWSLAACSPSPSGPQDRRPDELACRLRLVGRVRRLRVHLRRVHRRPARATPRARELPGASCVAASDEGSIALCGGQAPPRGLCLPRCDASRAPKERAAWPACARRRATPTARVTIDTAARHQTLVGFGASLAYADDAIVAHPDKAALYDLLFAESGLDVLRLRNRYERRGADHAAAGARDRRRGVAAARSHAFPLHDLRARPRQRSRRTDHAPAPEITESCTLVTLPGGRFDYAGLRRLLARVARGLCERGDLARLRQHPEQPELGAPGRQPERRLPLLARGGHDDGDRRRSAGRRRLPRLQGGARGGARPRSRICPSCRGSAPPRAAS